MPRRLIILEGASVPREVIPEGERLEIGRSPDGGVVLCDRTVSRRHAVIRKAQDGLVLEDLGSTFGTSVNGHSLPSGESLVLRDGDVVEFGKVQMVCRFEPEGRNLDEATGDAAFAAQANARLLLLEGEYVRRLPVASPVTLIGGAPHCDVRLQDRSGPPEHTIIRAVDGDFWVEPRNLTTLPRLNETQQTVVERTRLPSNSVLLVQRAQILFLYDFEANGTSAKDPLARISRSGLLRHVAQQSGHSYKHLKQLCKTRHALGQSVGEILMERSLVTPLFWRVLCSRLLKTASRQSWVGRLFRKSKPC